MIYIFDEPSTGMHPRDVHRMTRLLKGLRDKGNTVLVVEHDKDVIKIADEVIDVGPLAGKNGGQILFQGSFQDFTTCEYCNGSKYSDEALKYTLNGKTIVDRGNTEIVIEHNTDVMRLADYIIDVGPDGGTKGGEIVFTGTPKEMFDTGNTITAKYLRNNQ